MFEKGFKKRYIHSEKKTKNTGFELIAPRLIERYLKTETYTKFNFIASFDVVTHCMHHTHKIVFKL